MEIKKKNESYNTYTLTLSFGQMEAILNALATDHTGPVADELYAELEWYMSRLPKPGEDEKEEKAEAGGEPEGAEVPAGEPASPAAPEAAEAPEAKLDRLDQELPAPPA